MALILFGNGVADARGSINGTTFARNKAGAYARNRTVPVNPNTPSQSLNRARFGGQSAAWNALTAAQRDGWNFLATGATRINRLGQPYTPTGRQLFLESSNNLAMAGQTIIEDAPINADLPAPPSYTELQPTIAAGPPRTWTSLIMAGGVASAMLCVVKATAPNPGPKTNFTNQYRVIGSAGEVINLDIDTLYVNTYGSLPGLAGSIVSVLVSNLDTATGFRSAELRLDATLS